MIFEGFIIIGFAIWDGMLGWVGGGERSGRWEMGVLCCD